LTFRPEATNIFAFFDMYWINEKGTAIVAKSDTCAIPCFDRDKVNQVKKARKRSKTPARTGGHLQAAGQ
jgi:hypothetical protein